MVAFIGSTGFILLVLFLQHFIKLLILTKGFNLFALLSNLTSVFTKIVCFDYL